MSQPSLDEATHYRLDPVTLRDQYFKVGEETVYTWSDARNCWTFSLNNPRFIKALPGITELRKPVISPVVEASDRLGRTRMIGEIDPSDWRLNASPEVLQPIVSEEHGCTEEEVEEANEAFEDVGAFQHPNDKQVGGDHYKSMAVQPWIVFDDWLTKEQATGYYLASAIAYLARFNATGEGKGGLKDIQKAKHYLEKLESILLTNED